MDSEVIKKIGDILIEQYDVSCEQIPLIHNQIIELERMSDESFDPKGDAQFGREIKTRHLKELQYQLGYLAAIQTETIKFFDMLRLDVDGLEKLVETNKKLAEALKAKIEAEIEKCKR